MKVKVIFKKEEKTGDILAVFPECINNNGSIDIYTSNEGHSTATKSWLKNYTINATEEEYEDLKSEMIDLGYTLDIKIKMFLKLVV